MGWVNEKEGVAKVATSQALEEEEEELEEEEGQTGVVVTGEEYMAAAMAAAEQAAVDELSRQMVDGLLGTGEGGDEGVGYGESTLPGDGGAVDMQMGGGTLFARRAPANGLAGGAEVFSASDAPDTDHDWTIGENWIGRNGGDGFQAWQLQTDGAGVRESCSVDAGAGFTMTGNTEGESVAVRPLDIPLSAGRFSVTMNVASMDSADFLGLAVFDGENEILRWGYGTLDGVGALMYRTLGDTVYHSAQDNAYPLGPSDFILTWEQLATGGLMFTLSGTLLPGGMSVDVPNADQVAAIGVVLMNGWNEDGNEDAGIGVRNLQVEGTPAVPEPGVLGLLVAGMAALRGRRAKKEK